MIRRWKVCTANQGSMLSGQYYSQIKGLGGNESTGIVFLPENFQLTFGHSCLASLCLVHRAIVKYCANPCRNISSCRWRSDTNASRAGKWNTITCCLQNVSSDLLEFTTTSASPFTDPFLFVICYYLFL